MAIEAQAEPSLRVDRYLDGRIAIAQPARGYRAGLDAVLLAQAVEALPGARLMEAGCGAGTALIAVAARAPECSVLGVEREPAMAALAGENLSRNALGDRARVVCADALDVDAGFGVFDAVFCNPPFATSGQGRPPAPGKRYAHVGEHGVGLWIARLADRLRGGGVLTLIHRAERLGEILTGFEGRLGGVELYPLRPRANAPATRILARARKGSRAPLRLHAGLSLHDASGAKFSAEAEAILRGRALIPWSLAHG